MAPLLGLSALLGSSALALTPRAPLVVDPVELLPLPADAPMAGYQLTIKLRDGILGRATPQGGLLSRSGADLSALRRVSGRLGLRYAPLIALDEQRLDALEARAAARSGRAQPDLAGMLVVRPADASPTGLLAAGRALQALPEVEYAWIGVVGLPPPSDIGSTTPDYSSHQSYAGPDPGIDAEYAWSLGVTGSSVRFSDAEYGWIVGHEDLVDRDLHLESGETVPTWVASYGYDHHGTATIGEIAAVDNGYGCLGLMTDVDVHTFPEWSDEEGARRVTAITSAVDGSGPGDVVMMEMQTTGVGGGYGPAELDPDVWTVVRLGSDAGVVLVGAAGNGHQNLDSSTYATYMAMGDSGGILVGAGTGDTDHDAASFSTYGTRVDLQGWGDYTVFTLGYGYYATIDGDREQTYINNFSGTSSATPMVAAAAVAIQDFALSSSGTPLSPDDLRQLLVDTGVPQGTGGHIGPLPDLSEALEMLDPDGDGALTPSYGGTDCDDADSDIHPGAEDSWYDGVDTDCGGDDDFDADVDAYEAVDYGGTDCDDQDSTTYPGAPDTWYDGIDSDCVGDDDFDADADGHEADAYGGDDCDDQDSAVHPGVDDLQDGVDSDCDGFDAQAEDTGPADTAPTDSDGGQDSDGETGQADTGDPIKLGECACQSSPGAVVPWWTSALGLLVMRRRKRT